MKLKSISIQISSILRDREIIFGDPRAKTAGSAPSSWSNRLKCLFFYGFLTNFLFFILGKFVYMMRPIVNVDYFALAAISSFLPAYVNTGLLFATLCNDLSINLAPIYHFKIHEMIRSLRDVLHIEWIYFIPSALILLGMVSTLAILTGHATRTWRASLTNALFFISLGGVFFGLDILKRFVVYSYAV